MGLLLAPTQKLRKVVACPQRQDSDGYFHGIDFEFAEFRDYPHDSSIASTDNADYRFVLGSVLSEESKSFFFLGEEVEEVDLD